jgi:hypothetical protein
MCPPCLYRRPVHQGSGSSCLDCVGQSSPRDRSPRCYGPSVSLLSIPTGEPLGPGYHRQRVADLHPIGPTRLPCGRAGRVAGRGTGAGLQAGGLCLGSIGAGGRTGPSALVSSNPLELVAPGLPAPGEVTSSCIGLLAFGGLEAIGGIRAGVGGLGRVWPLSVLGLPGPRCVGTGRVGLCGSTIGPTQRGNDSGSVKRFATICVNRQL